MKPQIQSFIDSIALGSATLLSVRRSIKLVVAITTAAVAPHLLHAAPGAPPWDNPALVPANTQITIRWLPASGSPTSYKVRYRISNSPDAWTTITGLPLTPTNYVLTGQTNYQSLEIEVAASDGTTTTWNSKMHGRAQGLSHPSGLHAGGQVDGIVRAGANVMVVATDVAGFQRSIDAGETWQQSSTGIYQGTGTRAGATIAYHAASGTLYGVSGGDPTGNFWKSTDDGATWTNQHTGTDIAVQATGTVYPRGVGKLIAIDPANVNTIYLSTSNDGIKKSTNGGTSWTSLALSGKATRGIVLDSGFLYTVADGVGVYRCTTSGGSVTLFNGTNSPNNPEEPFVLAGKLYVAANTQGVRRLDSASTAAAGAAWKNLSIGGTTTAWCAVDGYVSGSNHVLIVGNSAAEQLGTTGRYTTMKKCTNAQASSGFTWVDISSAASTTVNLTIAAGNGETWWRVDPAKGENQTGSWGTEKRLDGSAFNIDQVYIDPDNPSKIHVVGQMGIWRTLDGGTNWYPAVLGLSNAVHNSVAVDPNNAGHVYVCDTDNGMWVSTDHAKSVAYVTKPNSGAKPLAYDACVEAATGNVYVAIGDGTTGDGDVWFYNPTARSWTNVVGGDGQSLKTKTLGATVHGVAVRPVSGSRVVLACVEGKGIWRLAAGGNWVQKESTTGSSISSLKSVSFEWPSTNTLLVYLYDKSTGVWRSQDGGLTWGLLWGQPFTSGTTGSLAMMTTDTTKLFVAKDDSVYRLDHADTGTLVVNDLSVPSPGKIAALGGTLWVNGRATSTSTADVDLRKSTDGSTFTVFSSNYFEGSSGFPARMAVESGFEYVACSTMGTVVTER